MKVGIIVGSNRKLSNTLGLANWVKYYLSTVSKEIQIFTPTDALLTTPVNFVAPMAVKSADDYELPVIQQYSKDISACDAFVFISPVYNHSYSGQFKAMIDHLFNEFANKPVVVIAQGPSAAPSALEAMVKLAKKYSMNVVAETSIKIPYHYVSTAQRVSHAFNPEDPTDSFLKEYETTLIENLNKLSSVKL